MPVTVASREAVLEATPAVDRRFDMISIVIPVAERQHDLLDMVRRFSARLATECRDIEFIIVFDGSMTPDPRLVLAARDDDRIQVVMLGQTFGEATLLRIGFERARGDIVITAPAYNQAADSGLTTIVQGLRDGEDLVIARRHPRRDGWVNRLQSKVFHMLVRSTSGVTFRDMACGLRGMRREVAESIPLYGDLHRFIPALALREGFRVAERNVEQHPLDSSPRVYRPGVYLRRMLDILAFFFLTRFTEKPLRFFGLIGSGLTGAGVILAGVISVQRMLGIPLANRPLLLLAVLMIAVGIQIVGLGLVGEIIVHVRAPHRRAYRVREII